MFDLPEEQVNKYKYVYNLENGLTSVLQQMLHAAHCQEIREKLRCNADVPRGFVCHGETSEVTGFGLFIDNTNDPSRVIRLKLECYGKLFEWIQDVKYEVSDRGATEESRVKESQKLKHWLLKVTQGNYCACVRPNDEILQFLPPQSVASSLLTQLQETAVDDSSHCITFITQFDHSLAKVNYTAYVHRVIHVDSQTQLMSHSSRSRVYFVFDLQDYNVLDVPQIQGCSVHMYSAFDPCNLSVSCVVMELKKEAEPSFNSRASSASFPSYPVTTPSTTMSNNVRLTVCQTSSPY